MTSASRNPARRIDAEEIAVDAPATDVAGALTEAILALEDGLALFDRDGVLVICNDAYRRAYPPIADLLLPGTSIREILAASAVRGGHAKSESEIADWVEPRAARHATGSGVGEYRLANNRWYRITERVTPAGFVLKHLTDITDKKALDQAIATLEGRVAESMDSLEEGLALFDPSDRLVTANRRYKEIFSLVADLIVPGVAFEALIRAAAARRQNVEALLNPEEWVENRLEIHRRASGTYEHRFANGGWILVRERRTAEGGIIGAYSDITQLKQREASLQRALDELEAAHVRIKNVIESSFDWNWTSDADGKVVCETRSDPAAGEFDPTLHIALAISAIEAARTRELDDSGTDFDDQRRPEPFRNHIYDGRLPNGRNVHLRISGNPVYDRTGQFIGYCGAASDVTDTVSAQREAASRAAALNATIESVSQGIIVFDSGLHLQIANQRALAMLEVKGYAPGDGLHLRQVIEPEIAERILAWRREDAATEMPVIEKREPSGAVVLVRANAMPDGGLVVTLSDVTDRAAAEERHHQAQKMMALGHLVGGVAHEFNNLLTSICGFSKMALDKVDHTALVQDCLEEVVLASDRAAQLTKQMLAFGRKQPIDPKVFPAAKIVVELQRMLRSLLPESIELSFSITDEKIHVRSDPAQMSQALLNLALNARDAMPDGGRLTLTLTTGMMPPSDDPSDTSWIDQRAAIYQVADTGTGIPEEVRQHIFDPFFTTKEQGKGTGLGLSFVHGVVERSGGRIQVESQAGSGTVFEVILPLVEPDDPVAGEEAPMVARDCAETILVVEDEPGVRGFARTVLADCGYEVLTAANRDEAVSLFGAFQTPPHLLLSDVVLPGPSGPEIARELLLLAPDMKVIFMTGYADRDGPHLSQLGPADMRIDKPFSQAALANAIRAALDGSGGMQGRTAVSPNDGGDHE